MNTVPSETYKNFNKVVELKRICADEISKVDWKELADLLVAHPKEQIKNNSPSWMMHWYNKETGPCAVEDSENERQSLDPMPDQKSLWLFLNFVDHDQGQHPENPTIADKFKNTLEYINQLDGVRHCGVHVIGSDYLIPYHTDSSEIYSMIATFSVSKNNPEKVELLLKTGDVYNFKDREFFTFVPSIDHSISNTSDDAWICLVLRINKTEFTQ